MPLRSSLPARAPRNARLAPRLAIAALLAALLARPVRVQEFALFGGPLYSADTRTTGWMLDYREELGKYAAASFSWVNEAKATCRAITATARPCSSGAGCRSPTGASCCRPASAPYRYFDTEAAEQGRGDSNTHGWGVLMSVRAAYYTSHRWIAQLQVNRVHTFSGPDTTSVLFGVGYQLDAPGTPGPRDHAAGRLDRVTHNEITGMVGETILNSRSSPTSLGASLEYRRGLRVVTRYDRDTDVIQAGIGYRF